jgi:hypothetical protein
LVENIQKKFSSSEKMDLSMTPQEVRELLRLKNWSQGELARQLEVQSSTVGRWLKGGLIAGPTKVILRAWLAQAREQKVGRKKKQPA